LLVPLGVGNNPEPVSAVGGVDGTSRNNKRPRGVAETFQVSKHVVERQGDETSNIFANDPSGSCECNNSTHLRPEVAVIVLACLLSGDGERLAGESSAYEVDPSKASQSACVNVMYVLKAGDFGPVLAEDGLAIGVSLAESNRSHSSAFKSKAEPSNARKKVKDSHRR